MKKVLSFSLLLAAVLVMSFASCKNNKPEPPTPGPDTPKEENIKYEFFEAGFLEYSVVNGKQTSLYKISFIEEGVLNGNSVVKKGKAISVVFAVNEIVTNIGFRPANNTYTKENGLMLDGGKNASDVYDVELDGTMKKSGVGFKDDAQLIVDDGGKVTFTATDKKNIKRSISVDNAIYANIGRFRNEDFSLVPPGKYSNLSTNGNKKLVSEVIDDKVRAIYLVTNEDVYSGDKLMAHIVLFVKKSASVIEDGTYPIGRSFQAGTVLASDGVTKKEAISGVKVDGSCLFNTKSGGGINKAFHIVSGDVTVTATNPPDKTEGDIAFAGKTYFGHKIIFTYTGSLKP